MQNEKRTGRKERKGEVEYVWSARNGAELKAVIQIVLSNYEDIAYADGDNIYLGQKNMISTTETAYMDGKNMGSGRVSGCNNAEQRAMGVVGGIGRIGYIQSTCDKIDALIAEKINELKKDFPEYLEQEKIDNEKKAMAEAHEKEHAAQYEKNIKNGMCPKCGTWCYGDCETR